MSVERLHLSLMPESRTIVNSYAILSLELYIETGRKPLCEVNLVKQHPITTERWCSKHNVFKPKVAQLLLVVDFELI